LFIFLYFYYFQEIIIQLNCEYYKGIFENRVFYLRMFCCFSFNISFYLIFAFFFLLSQKKEEKCSQKEERKTVVDF